MCSRRKSAEILVTVLLISLVSISARAQEEVPDSTLDTTATIFRASGDTVIFDPGDVLSDYSPVDKPINFEERRTQNPTVALFKSMVIPGLGQLGNGKYFKAALFLGADAWFISSALKHGRDAADLRDQFESITGDDAVSVQERRELYAQYQDKRDSRNWFTWLAVITSFVSMFDAYTDAHLSGFPIKDDEDVTISLLPTTREDAVFAALEIRF